MAEQTELAPLPDHVQRATIIAAYLAGLSRFAEGEELAFVRQLLDMATIAAREVIVSPAPHVRADALGSSSSRVV